MDEKVEYVAGCRKPTLEEVLADDDFLAELRLENELLLEL